MTRGRILLAVTAAAIVALATVFLAKPVLAQRTLVSAMNSEANGDLLRAKHEYRRAIELDPWYGFNSRLYARIGRLDEVLGRRDSAEYELYSAQLIFDESQGVGSTWRLAAAIVTLDHVAQTGGPIAESARISSIDMRLLYGLRLFQDGAFGSAVSVWNAVLEREPDNWLAAYYLTWGDPTINGYRHLAKLAERFLAQCVDPLTIGIFYNSLGDSQIELGDLDAARASYYASYKRDYIRNRNAISALIGP
jgi:tetratricopeptide (TPR) repeat protein